MARGMATIARRLGTTLVLAGVVAAAGLGATYLLALAALDDLQPLRTEQRGFASDAVEIADGSSRVVTMNLAGEHVLKAGGKQLAAFAGHGVPVRQAMLVASGTEVVSADASGVVRLTHVDELRTVGQVDFSPFTEVIRTRLWVPYGRPLAELALHGIAQVLPLHIPEAFQGRRGRAFRDCKDGFCGPEMVELGRGYFLMGSPWTEEGRSSDEGPRRLRRISEGMAVARTEITFDDWDACNADGGCTIRPDDEGVGRGRIPVFNVSYDDVTTQFLPWLNRKLGLAQSPNRYRLPTETEWEFAARGGSTSAYPLGTWNLILKSNFKNDRPIATDVPPPPSGPSSLTPPNRFGLHDMFGNVEEWVDGCYWERYADAQCPQDYEFRVARGGAYNSPLRLLRAAHRTSLSRTTRSRLVGFRIMRNDPPGVGATR